MGHATYYSKPNRFLAASIPEAGRTDFEYFAGRGSRIDLDHYDELEETRTRQYKRGEAQTVLELYDAVEERGVGYLERARAREALAHYLRDTVAAAYPWVYQYRELADALQQARQHGLWGVGDRALEDGNTLEPNLAIEWTGRVGQVKLCPDDAREESARVAGVYVPRLEQLIKDGCEVRYCVFTFPNSPRGFLKADIYGIIEHFKRAILLRRDDGTSATRFNDPKRTFGYIKGALATVEAPLSAKGEWNVHLNVMLVCSDRPDYKALRDAWGEGIQAEFKTVPLGAERAALRELVKYPLKAISLKSEEKAASGSRAPPVIEWPAEAFHEWWGAHKGFRRTRSWGLLYAGNIEDSYRPIDRHSIEWLGKLWLSPARFKADRPMIDTTASDERNEAYAAREHDRRQAVMFDALEGISDAYQAHLDLILGNKSANDAEKSDADAPFS